MGSKTDEDEGWPEEREKVKSRRKVAGKDGWPEKMKMEVVG